MENSKYYWIRLKTDFFNREDIDFLLSQENGCQYVVLYQMLCLNTANTNGNLQTKMNEVIVPYDIKKIVRDCKYFDYDTVVIALELFKKLGLIYEQEDGSLKIANYEDMVGSVYSDDHYKENNRLRQQRFRDKQKLISTESNVTHNVTVTRDITLNRNTDIRDKILDIRDRDNINNKKEIYKERKKPFTVPTIEEVSTYCEERGNAVDPQKFYDFYESKGWMVGKNKMKDWKACIRTWERGSSVHGENSAINNLKDMAREYETNYKQPTTEEEQDFNHILNDFK